MLVRQHDILGTCMLGFWRHSTVSEKYDENSTKHFPDEFCM